MSEHSPNFLTCPVPGLDESGKLSPPPATPKPPKPEREAKPRRGGFPWKRMVALVVFVAILAITIPPGIALAQAYSAAQSVKAALAKAKVDSANLDFAAASADLAQARSSAQELRDALGRVGFWRDMPYIGTQIRGLEDSVSAGIGTLDGAQDLFDAFQAIMDAMRGGADATGNLGTGISSTRRFNDLSKQEKRELLQKFADALPKMRLARDKIDLALELWNRVPQNELAGPIRQALKPLADNLPVLKKSLDEALPLLEVTVPLAGYPNPLRYFIFLQNADEMRPSGGFIGNVGTMTLDAGDLSEFAFTDVYNIDNPVSAVWKEVPPVPMTKYLKVPAWFMRDANWSPDFPTSAARVIDFYTRERIAANFPDKNPPQMVVALEPGLFTGLLRITGPITAQGKVFDADNFFDKLEYEVEIGFQKENIPIERRKDLVDAIGKGIVDRLKQLPASRWPELLDLLTVSLARKDIMMYAKDPSLMSLLDRKGWTGRAKGTTGDFLWTIDANLAALKTDGVMDKSVTYAVDATDPQHPIGTATLTYKNTNREFTWKLTRYRSYTRIYVPDGSTLISTEGAMSADRTFGGQVDIMHELGKTVFGAFWSIEPGHTQTLKFKYALPPSAVASVASGSYHLDLPKQPGADATRLTLDLLFGKNILSATPPEDKTKWGDAKYQVQTDTLQDREFNLKF